MSEEILEFLKGTDVMVSTTELFDKFGEGFEKRKHFYEELTKMERRHSIGRSHGLEANGHTLCFTWAAL